MKEAQAEATNGADSEGPDSLEDRQGRELGKIQQLGISYTKIIKECVCDAVKEAFHTHRATVRGASKRQKTEPVAGTFIIFNMYM